MIKGIDTTQVLKTKCLLEVKEMSDRQPTQYLRYLRGLNDNTVGDDLLRTI